ncbi:TPA_asm: UL37.6 [Human alphaherpesvirus 1]|nr:TPA_asm: UL37.6 [Human alphaherpesvirus 1]
MTTGTLTAPKRSVRCRQRGLSSGIMPSSAKAAYVQVRAVGRPRRSGCQRYSLSANWGFVTWPAEQRGVWGLAARPARGKSGFRFGAGGVMSSVP